MVETVDTEFEALLDYLRVERGADFTGYKRKSLTRLVDRRLSSLGVSSYGEYVDRLQVESDELPALLDSLLVNVTAFFRDPAVWDLLRDELLPAALAELGPTEPVRVWSAACATGEEAYTLAMVLHQLLGGAAFAERVKVYATDVDEAALQVARIGRYPLEALGELPPGVADYFVPDGAGVRVREDLRAQVVFGRHDLLQDAPISRITLLSCRNVLMYLMPGAQTRVLERFPWALHEQGLLVLGKAEMLLSQSALFTPVSLPHRVFRARRVPPVARLAALAVGGPGRDTQLRRVTDAVFSAAPDAQLVIDRSGVLSLLNEQAEATLGLSRESLGRPFAVLDIARRPTDLRGVVASVQADGAAVELGEVTWPAQDDDETGQVARHWTVRVAALHVDEQVVGVHVVFTDTREQHGLRVRLEEVRAELTSAYEELQSQSEELETSNEELQSAVEELDTTNEELQSTNEELETMNEELQSTNEELHTLNEELRDRTLQVDEANSVLQSIVDGLDHPVAVIDADYRVQLWNPAAARLTGLRDFEVEGVLLLDVELGLPVEKVHAAVRAVLGGHESEVVLAVEVVNRFGQAVTRHLRARPLTHPRSGVRGVVVMLEDLATAEG